jgi:hypothetical protein
MTDLGHSWSRTLPGDHIGLLPRRGWCIAGLRYQQALYLRERYTMVERAEGSRRR